MEQATVHIAYSTLEELLAEATPIRLYLAKTKQQHETAWTAVPSVLETDTAQRLDPRPNVILVHTWTMDLGEYSPLDDNKRQIVANIDQAFALIIEWLGRQHVGVLGGRIAQPDGLVLMKGTCHFLAWTSKALWQASEHWPKVSTSDNQGNVVDGPTENEHA